MFRDVLRLVTPQGDPHRRLGRSGANVPFRLGSGSAGSGGCSERLASMSAGEWRLVFRWESGDVHEVEIVDYH
jgi:hypothetical protein